MEGGSCGGRVCVLRTQPLPSKTLKNPPNDPDGTELFGETVNLGWKSSSPFEVFMDEEPGGNSDDPVVLENLKEKISTFKHRRTY